MLFRPISIYLWSLFFASSLHALPESVETGAAITQVSETKYQLGKISFDQETREISFLVTGLIRDNIVEYLVVGNQGKVHESLFFTEINPLNLNIIFKLLNYKESKEIFPLLDEDFVPTNAFPVVPEATKKAARLQITASWQHEKKTVSYPVTDLIQHKVTTKAMPASPWLYTGSYIHDGKFKPTVGGDYIAIRTDEGSIVNCTDKDRDDDEFWYPYISRLPAPGTIIILTLSPWKQ